MQFLSEVKYCTCCSRHDESSASAKANAPSRTKESKKFSRHPDFPKLPASVPLTYTLTMTACLSQIPKERPTFQQLQRILSDLGDEVGRGFYINGQGRAQVCNSHVLDFHPGLSEALYVRDMQYSCSQVHFE